LVLEFLEHRELLSVTVMTDQTDYAPAATAQISASGFLAGETVQFQVLHTDGTANTGSNETPWQVTDTSGMGNLQTSWYLDPADTGSFEVIAVGQTSGDVATALFDDSTAYSPPIVPAASSVATDQSNYGAGDTAIINSSGFLAGETVQFQVLHTDGSSNSGSDHAPWQVTDTSGTGNIQTSWYVDPSDNAGASLRVIAIGQTSGEVATEDFTDGISLSFPTGANAEGGASFTLTVNKSGTTAFASNSQVTWTPSGGSAVTLTRLSQSSSQLTATVTANLIADEGTASVTVTNTTGAAPGTATFTITDVPDNVTATTGPNITATEGTAVTPSTLATFKNSFANSPAGDFKVTSVNWGDGNIQTTFSPAPTISVADNVVINGVTVSTISVSGVSHTYTDEGLFTTVKTATTLPASGTYTIPIANNGTNGFAASGTITIYTPTGGFQTVSYTGVTTGTSASFTGCSGGTGTLAVGSPITQPFASVSVTLAPADSGDTWAPSTATGSVSVQESTVALTTNSFAPGNLYFTEGKVHGSTQPSLGTVTDSNTSAPASDFVATMDWGDGSPHSTLTVSGSGGTYTMNYPPGHVYANAGQYTYSLTVYEGNGTPLKTSTNTISVADGGPLSSYQTITQTQGIITLPLSNGTINVSTNGTTNFPSSGILDVASTYVTYTGKTASSFTGCSSGGSGTIPTNSPVTAGVSAVVGNPTPTLTVLKFSDPGTLIGKISSFSQSAGTITLDNTTNVTNFPTSGTITVDIGGSTTTFIYTSQTAPNTFAGCTGNFSAIANGDAVTFQGGSTTG